MKQDVALVTLKIRQCHFSSRKSQDVVLH